MTAFAESRFFTSGTAEKDPELGPLNHRVFGVIPDFLGYRVTWPPAAFDIEVG